MVEALLQVRQPMLKHTELRHAPSHRNLKGLQA